MDNAWRTESVLSLGLIRIFNGQNIIAVIQAAGVWVNGKPESSPKGPERTKSSKGAKCVIRHNKCKIWIWSEGRIRSNSSPVGRILSLEIKWACLDLDFCFSAQPLQPVSKYPWEVVSTPLWERVRLFWAGTYPALSGSPCCLLPLVHGKWLDRCGQEEMDRMLEAESKRVATQIRLRRPWEVQKSRWSELWPGRMVMIAGTLVAVEHKKREKPSPPKACWRFGKEMEIRPLSTSDLFLYINQAIFINQAYISLFKRIV